MRKSRCNELLQCCGYFYKTKRNIYIYDNLRCVRIPRKDPDLGQTLSRFALLAPSWDHLEN